MSKQSLTRFTILRLVLAMLGVIVTVAGFALWFAPFGVIAGGLALVTVCYVWQSIAVEAA